MARPPRAESADHLGVLSSIYRGSTSADPIHEDPRVDLVQASALLCALFDVLARHGCGVIVKGVVERSCVLAHEVEHGDWLAIPGSQYVWPTG